MSTNELYDRINSWLWLYDHVPFDDCNDGLVMKFNNFVSKQWADDMLIDVADWKMPAELLGKSAEQDLRAAINLAKTYDRSMIPDIKRHLLIVVNYLTSNHFEIDNSHRN